MKIKMSLKDICLFLIVYILSCAYLIRKVGISFNSIFLEILLFISYIYLYFVNKKNISYEKKFLATAIPVGLLFLFFIPLGNIPDERNHFARAYEISQFHLISEKNGDLVGRYLPSIFDEIGSNNSYNDIISLINYDDIKYDFISFNNTALYSFVCYIPQSFGIFVGNLFKLPLIISGYLGRLMNFATWLILLYLTIKTIPFGKKIIYLISMFPITLQEAVSLSPDELTFATSVLLFAVTLKFIYTESKIKTSDYCLISILCIILSLCKIIYLPLCLIIFLIPYQKFPSKKIKYIFIFSLAFFVIIINLSWLSFASGLLDSTSYSFSVNKNFVLHNPIKYLFIIVRTIFYRGEPVIFGAFGNYLESFNVTIPYIFVWGNMFIFAESCKEMKNCKKIAFTKNGYYLLVFIVLSICLLMFTSLYLQWNVEYSGIIEGIQGRYFLPILYIIPFLFMKKSVKQKNDKNIFNENDFSMNNWLILQNVVALIFIFSIHM